MSFFRVVIYLLIWSEFNLYIAYRGLAGSQLKNLCLCQEDTEIGGIVYDKSDSERCIIRNGGTPFCN